MRGLILATASVIALGMGGVGAANAWSGHSGSSMGPQAGTPPSSLHRSAARHITGAVSHRRGMVKQAQQILQRDGLYRGRIDGILGPETRRAIARFQRQNGLRVTANLDQRTMASLMGGGTAGYGAGTPPRMHRHMTTGQTRTGQAPPANEPGTPGPGAPPGNTTPGTAPGATTR